VSSELVGIRINGKLIKLDSLSVKTIISCVDSSDIMRGEHLFEDRTFKGFEIHGVEFYFKNEKLTSIEVKSSDNRYIGKILLVDNHGNEVDIYDKFDFVKMIYPDSTGKTMFERLLDSSVINIDDFSNMECVVNRGKDTRRVSYFVKNEDDNEEEIYL
jgi:hypothetical protein